MTDTRLITVPVNLGNNSPQCNNACAEIVGYMEEYINETKESEDFIMAIVHLKEFNGFEDFFMNCIGTKRRGEYRAALNAGYYTKVLSVTERNQRVTNFLPLTPTLPKGKAKCRKSILNTQLNSVSISVRIIFINSMVYLLQITSGLATSHLDFVVKRLPLIAYWDMQHILVKSTLCCC